MGLGTVGIDVEVLLFPRQTQVGREGKNKGTGGGERSVKGVSKSGVRVGGAGTNRRYTPEIGDGEKEKLRRHTDRKDCAEKWREGVQGGGERGEEGEGSREKRCLKGPEVAP